MSPDEPRCEELVQHHTVQCPNRARWRVIAPAWTMLMCGTHAGPWRRTAGAASYHRSPSLHTVEALA